MSFKRSGELLGKPRITYYKPGGDEAARARFRQSVVDALGRCTPMPFTPAFGAAIAGRPIAIRFIDDRRT